MTVMRWEAEHTTGANGCDGEEACPKEGMSTDELNDCDGDVTCPRGNRCAITFQKMVEEAIMAGEQLMSM